MADYLRSDGKSIITSIVVTYEVSRRVGDHIQHALPMGWDHGVLRSLGAACAAGKIMGLDQEQMGHAISLAVVPNLSLGQTRVGELSMWKGCAGPNGTRAGILAAQLAQQGMRDGAFGFATGLTYPPGAYSDTDELVAVCQAISDLGGFYVTHVRYSLGDRLLDPFREAITIGRRGGVPVHISHYHNPVDGMGEKMVALVDEGRNSGIDVTFDQYPYPAASTVLHSLLPYWVHAGGPTALLQRIQDRRVRDEIGDSVDPQWGLTLDHYIFSHIKSDKNKEWEGRSLTDLAHSQGKQMVDAICDLLIEEDLEVAFVARTGNPDNIRCSNAVGPPPARCCILCCPTGCTPAAQQRCCNGFKTVGFETRLAIRWTLSGG